MERDLATVDPPVLRLVCGTLLCRGDRARMAAVCRRWLFAIREDPILMRSLPLLFFPNCAQPCCSCIWCLQHHNLALPEEISQARCIGSYDGGWLLVAEEHTTEHRLFNVMTSQRILLPDEVTHHADREAVPAQILVACLSSSPLSDQCIGAAIIRGPLNFGFGTDRDLMFWNIGAAAGGCVTGWRSRLHDLPRAEAEDILFRNGFFYVLASNEQIFAIRPEFEETLKTEMHTFWFAGPPPDDDLLAARYLVESRGDILLVRRYIDDADELTDRIQVLTLEVHSYDPERYTWQEMPAADLAGRLLFLSHGCSRSYDTSDFPGQVDGVCFKPDMDWFDEDEWMGLSAEGRQNLSEDAGIWYSAHGVTAPLFDAPSQLQEVKCHSAPAWILPRQA